MIEPLTSLMESLWEQSASHDLPNAMTANDNCTRSPKGPEISWHLPSPSVISEEGGARLSG